MSDKKIKIVEVGARDGLQNISEFVPTALKIELINRLAETGLTTIEAGSFVSPEKIPQLADSADVITGFKKHKSIQFPVLVPNLHGIEAALAAGVDHIAVFASASETFSQKNINCSIAESLERYQAVIELARTHQIPIRGYLSCCLGCPYEGEISPKTVSSLAKKLFNMGCYEISLGDTIGTGRIKSCELLIKTVSDQIPVENCAAHFHNTYGQALVNLYAVIQQGIRTIDASIAGLGGCPYAKGASGNVSTEDVVYMLEGMGFDTGIDLEKLIDVSAFICEKLNFQCESQVTRAYKPVIASAAKQSSC